MPGREVIIVLRRNEQRQEFNIVCPAAWSKARLLAYVRDAHPKSTVKIKQWLGVGRASDVWEVKLWIAGME